MIDLMLKGIIVNSNRIDSITKHINKTNIKNAFIAGLFLIDIYVITKTVQKHEERIKNIEEQLKLESRIKDVKSKGE